MRHHAPLLTSIWDDEDFCALSGGEQRMYMQLLSQKRLSIVGVVPYTPRNWVRGCSELTLDGVLGLLGQLESKRYVLIDLETEELLVRTILKHDPPRGWKSIRGMWNAWLEVDSKPLRRAILEHVTEEMWTTENAPPPDAAKALRNTPSDGASHGASHPPSDGAPLARASHHPPSTTHLPPASSSTPSTSLQRGAAHGEGIEDVISRLSERFTS